MQIFTDAVFESENWGSKGVSALDLAGDLTSKCARKAQIVENCISRGLFFHSPSTNRGVKQPVAQRRASG